MGQQSRGRLQAAGQRSADGIELFSHAFAQRAATELDVEGGTYRRSPGYHKLPDGTLWRRERGVAYAAEGIDRHEWTQSPWIRTTFGECEIHCCRCAARFRSHARRNP